MKFTYPNTFMRKVIFTVVALTSYTPVTDAQVLPSVTRTVTQPIEDISRRAANERITDRIQPRVAPALPDLLPELKTTLTTELSQALLPVKQALNVVNSIQQTVIREEITPQGDLAIAREWVLYVSDADLTWLSRSSFNVVKQHYVSLLDNWLVSIRVPHELNSVQAMKASLPAHLQTQLGRNHIYLTQAGSASGTMNSEQNKLNSAAQLCNQPSRIGMLDSAIEMHHPLLTSLSITQQRFLDESLPISQAHGTAVAGILQQQLSQRSQVFNAAVFYSRTQVSQGASVFDLISGMDWLSKQQVSVINMSLTGPQNPLLAKAITRLSKSGITLVAAVGNAGPAAPPLYPAAFPEVIGVSAVDANGTIYRWANQGEQVAASASGVSVITARINGETGPETGTSMASPVIAGWLSHWLACESSEATGLVELPRQLRDQLQDKGEPGWDPVYGEGVWLP